MRLVRPVSGWSTPAGPGKRPWSAGRCRPHPDRGAPQSRGLV